MEEQEKTTPQSKESLENPQNLMDRRNFMKKLGIGTAATAATVAASSVLGDFASGNDKYVNGPGKQRDAAGSSLITRDLPEHFYKRIEPKTGYVGTTQIVRPAERLDARMHGFARMVYCTGNQDFSEENSGKWGPALQKALADKAEYMAGIGNDERIDWSWSNAFQHAMDRFHISMEPGRFPTAPIAAAKVEMSAEEATTRLKKVARWFGMEQVGICEITDDLKPYFYSVGRTSGTYTPGPAGFSDPGREIPWPYPYKYCIVMMDKCDRDTLNALRGPLVEASAKIACADSDFAPHYLETIIRMLGYDAKANIFSDTDIIEAPIAVAAGLGELGRSGLLISPWGADFRLCEVFTNMPLIPDKPMDFGLQEFCKVCKKCAENCPAGAISMDDDPSEFTTTVTSIRWAQDGVKCLSERLARGCSTCQGVCPWTKPDTLIHEIGRTFGQGKTIAPLLVSIDDFFYGRYPEPHKAEDYAPWR